MSAHVGDRIILAAEHVDEPVRDGEVLEVRGPDGGPPYLVRWTDGHTGLIYPGPGSVLRIGEPGPAASEDAERVEAPGPGNAQRSADHPSTVHLREWRVRVSLLESGDDTRATVVLVADPPDALTARGASHRAPGDQASRAIGEEVAVARALHHLADQLTSHAERAIEQHTGEAAHVWTT